MSDDPRPSTAAPMHPAVDRAYVLGVVSLVGAVLVLPLLLGPWAWHLGFVARREIDREPGRWDGRRRATAGMVLGAVASVVLALLVLGLVGWAVGERLRLVEDTGY